MNATAARIARACALPTVGLALVAVVAPDARAEAVQVWALVVVGIAAAVVAIEVRGLYPLFPAPRVAGRRRSPQPQRPGALARLEREVSMASISALDVHLRLRPTLREIASQLVRAHGADLEHGRERAQALVGGEVWELVRPDRPPPPERHTGGIDRQSLERIVGSLERLVQAPADAARPQVAGERARRQARPPLRRLRAGHPRP
jgi:hypothetical protein